MRDALSPLAVGAADDLRQAAEAARVHAYAPYSKFTVGAAIRTASGAIYAGTNVENAAYPVGTCAEAGAIAAMIAGGDRKIVEVMVTGPGTAAITPCGACRQRIREFAGPDTPIHAGGPGGIKASFTLGALLPEAFGPAILGAADV
ncbi:cytidine deaminase [Beijerinckia sp. L45]|uniref:cytidine deaminase n=1 Tax=Beijerinckia sp. L45 TaxID=1641855 RepID=UPI001FF044F0|nr:cytidine deaminase [Beijerinckia sp. L45]